MLRFVFGVICLVSVYHLSLAQSISAQFFVDAGCTQPLSSFIPYPSYSNWNTLQGNQIANFSGNQFCVNTTSIANVASGKYVCNFYEPTSTWSIQAWEFFDSNTCEFSTRYQILTASNFKNGACTVGSYRNTSMASTMQVYAIASCEAAGNSASSMHPLSTISSISVAVIALVVSQIILG